VVVVDHRVLLCASLVIGPIKRDIFAITHETIIQLKATHLCALYPQKRKGVKKGLSCAWKMACPEVISGAILDGRRGGFGVREV